MSDILPNQHHISLVINGFIICCCIIKNRLNIFSGVCHYSKQTHFIGLKIRVSQVKPCKLGNDVTFQTKH